MLIERRSGMRQKSKVPAARRRRRATATASGDPVEWLVTSETGWGLPHPWIAMIAAIIVGVRGVLHLVDRAVSRRAATPRPPGD
jgi:hypothetical protein